MASAMREPDPDRTALRSVGDVGRAGRINRDQRPVAQREDIRSLPEPLKTRLIEMTGHPHSFLPLTAFSQADDSSQLFTYYLLDTENLQRRAGIHRYIYRYLEAVRDQQRERLVRGLDDTGHAGPALADTRTNKCWLFRANVHHASMHD